MTTVEKSIFTKYAFNEEELTAAHTLTTANLQHLYTLRASTAEARLALDVDPVDVKGFIQQESYLKGQMAAYTYLIDLAESAQQELSDPQ